jgi:hypothetical protein
MATESEMQANCIKDSHAASCLPASLLPPLDGGMFLVMLANYYGASCKSYWLLILPSAPVDMLPESKLFDDY